MNEKFIIIIIIHSFFLPNTLLLNISYLSRLATATCTCEPNYFLMSSPLKKIDVDAIPNRVPYADFVVKLYCL